MGKPIFLPSIFVERLNHLTWLTSSFMDKVAAKDVLEILLMNNNVRLFAVGLQHHQPLYSHLPVSQHLPVSHCPVNYQHLPISQSASSDQPSSSQSTSSSQSLFSQQSTSSDQSSSSQSASSDQPSCSQSTSSSQSLSSQQSTSSDQSSSSQSASSDQPSSSQSTSSSNRHPRLLQTPEEDQKDFFKKLNTAKTKPAILKIVDPYFEQFIPKTLQPSFPKLLGELYNPSTLTLKYPKLMEECEKVFNSYKVYANVRDTNSLIIEFTRYLLNKSENWKQIQGISLIAVYGFCIEWDALQLQILKPQFGLILVCLHKV